MAPDHPPGPREPSSGGRRRRVVPSGSLPPPDPARRFDPGPRKTDAKLGTEQVRATLRQAGVDEGALGDEQLLVVLTRLLAAGEGEDPDDGSSST